MTAFNGDGKAPNKSALALMAKHAAMDPKEIKYMAEEIIDNLSNAKTLLQNVGVTATTSKNIISTINGKCSHLKQLL